MPNWSTVSTPLRWANTIKTLLEWKIVLFGGPAVVGILTTMLQWGRNDPGIAIIYGVCAFGACCGALVLAGSTLDYFGERLLEPELPTFQYVESVAQLLVRYEPRVAGMMAFTSATSDRTFYVSKPVCWVIAAKIKNSPLKKTKESRATDVTAVLRFLEPSGREACHFDGVWILESGDPGEAGAIRTGPKIDIDANDTPERLYISVKPLDSSIAYGYVQQAVNSSLDVSDPRFALPLEAYDVEIILACSQRHPQSLRLKLTNTRSVTSPLALEMAD